MADETISQESEQFYAGAYGRIVRVMVAVAVALSVVALVRFGAAIAAGFAVGCAIGMLNFHWLKRVVSAFADRATGSSKKAGSAGVVLRFLLRYLLVAAVAYVIFRVSLASLYGLLAGLFLPVAAIMIEAVYEVYVALRRGV
ncbi:MAG TPA: ATP synthase subunit I [Terriglobales bacterium]|nr:ATP synthase subunit I [Terriglobales bacterium]